MKNRRKSGTFLRLVLILAVFFAVQIPAAADAAETAGPQVRKQTEEKKSQTGWRKEKNKTFYYLANGSMARGLKVIGGKTYYFSQKGVMQTGWKKINGKIRYFNPANGVMWTGFRRISQKRYYFQENGVLKTGWIKAGDDSYYADANGVIQTGWQKIDGKLYFFSLKRGAMRTGFWKIGQKKYYFQKDGALQAGSWLTIDGKRYYAGYNGVIRTGWQKNSGKIYYFDENGVLQTGLQKVDGNSYYFDVDGVLQTGWQKIGGSDYYFDESGKMITGWTKIDGMDYFFDTATGKLDTEKTPQETPLERLCRQIVESQVKESDSINTKLSKLFQYVTWKHSYLRSYSFTGASGWHKTYAYNMLTSKRGNCYSYAAAFAYLAKKATGLPVRVGWGGTPARLGGLTPHGWCEIRINGVWYVFDPDLYRYVYYGNCYYKTMGQIGGYYYNRHYATVDF